MSSMISRIRVGFRRLLRPPLHKPTVQRSYTFLGTEYGGWPLLNDTPPGALIYSFGVGEDISFDLGAIKKFGVRIHAFDPTPKSIQWLARQSLPPGFVFHPAGIAAKDGEALFAAPPTLGHVSFAATTKIGDDSPGAIKAPVKRLTTFIGDLGGIVPDVVKIDVEGFEYEVIGDILASRVRPKQFLVEFHHDLYGFGRDDTRGAVGDLLGAGYELFFVGSSGREYGFAFGQHNGTSR